MITINYKDILDKLKIKIQNWQRRHLTPIGKITVIKTLLVYQCLDWLPSYVHYHPIIPCSITSINIFLYELPLFLGSEHSQTQPSEDFVHVFLIKTKV